MEDVITFSATIEKVPSEGGWHIIRLPDDMLLKLRAAAGKNGNVPILATIGNTTWPTTIMSMGDQRWFLAVSAHVRKTESLGEGSSVSITIAPDESRLKKSVP
jgi:hypothetical protein